MDSEIVFNPLEVLLINLKIKTNITIKRRISREIDKAAENKAAFASCPAIWIT